MLDWITSILILVQCGLFSSLYALQKSKSRRSEYLYFIQPVS